MKEQLLQLILRIVGNYGEEMESEVLKNAGPETALYGVDGHLDSIALVSLIADLEMEISDEYNRDLTLADERAMSQRNSPFKTVQSLVDYIYKLLNEEV